MIEDILRLSEPEPVFIGDGDIHSLVIEHPNEYLDYLITGLSNIKAGGAEVELPRKQIFLDPGVNSDFRVMPCVVRTDTLVRKTVKLVGTNTQQKLVPGQITVGQAFHLHPQENFITHRLAACILSSVRTAACICIAIEALGSEAKSVSIIGCGRIGFYTALFLGARGNTKQIFLSDCDDTHPSRLKRTVEVMLPGSGIDFFVEEPAAAVDVVVTATSSEQVVYSASRYSAQTVISVGADTDCQRELSDDLLDGSDLIVDTLDSLNYGDVKRWLDKGLIRSCDVRELMDFLPVASHDTHDRRRLFVSTGSALFDNLTIGFILENLGSPA